jgi:hypothetical protein
MLAPPPAAAAARTLRAALAPCARSAPFYSRAARPRRRKSVEKTASFSIESRNGRR